jgi:hypothetical protein
VSNRKIPNLIFSIMFITSLLFGGVTPAIAEPPSQGSAPAQQLKGPVPNDEIGQTAGNTQMRSTTSAMRQAAASRQTQAQIGTNLNFAGINPYSSLLSPLSQVGNTINGLGRTLAQMAPLAPPDYFGVANWANSPLPTITAGVVSGGMRKFVDTLPGLCPLGSNNLGQCIPLAVADISTFSGVVGVPNADYYEIGLVEYHEQMHSDLPLPGTKLRGYVQLYPLGTTQAQQPLPYPLPRQTA